MEATPPAKRGLNGSVNGSTAKRPRVEGLGEEAAAMRRAFGAMQATAPALWANLREFEEELHGCEASGYGSERAYLKHVELEVFLRAMRVTLGCSLYDSNVRVDKSVVEGVATGWERPAEAGASVEDRIALGKRMEALDALGAAVARWRRARLEATAPRPRLWRLARSYDLEEGATQDRILQTLIVLSCAQSDCVRAALVEDDHARRAHLICRLQGCKRVVQLRFNVGVFEATPQRKALTL